MRGQDDKKRICGEYYNAFVLDNYFSASHYKHLFIGSKRNFVIVINCTNIDVLWILEMKKGR